jgi:hypothetical protein
MAISDGVAANAANFNAAFADFGSFALTYKAIIGSSSGCTHATLAAAISDVGIVAGSRILVTENYTVDTSPISISKANLQIDFSPAVTYTAGTSVTGITIDAAGIKIRGGRFSGFTTAISISSTFNYNWITECRFATCTNEVVEVDATPNNVILGNITE